MSRWERRFDIPEKVSRYIDFRLAAISPGDDYLDYNGATNNITTMPDANGRLGQGFNIYHSNLLVGSVLFIERTTPGGRIPASIYIGSLYVRPEYRDTNAFYKLIMPVMTLSKEKGLPISGIILNRKLEDVADKLDPSRFVNLASNASGDGWLECDDGETRWGLYGAAGVLFKHIDPDGMTRYLLTERSGVHMSGTWSVPGGAIDQGEDPLEASLREAREEIGYSPKSYHVVDKVVFQPATNWSYTTFIVQVDDQFDASQSMNYEQSAVKWVTKDEMSGLPLHPGFATIIPKLSATYSFKVQSISSLNMLIDDKPRIVRSHSLTQPKLHVSLNHINTSNNNKEMAQPSGWVRQDSYKMAQPSTFVTDIYINNNASNMRSNGIKVSDNDMNWETRKVWMLSMTYQDVYNEIVQLTQGALMVIDSADAIDALASGLKARVPTWLELEGQNIDEWLEQVDWHAIAENYIIDEQEMADYEDRSPSNLTLPETWGKWKRSTIETMLRPGDQAYFMGAQIPMTYLGEDQEGNLQFRDQYKHAEPISYPVEMIEELIDAGKIRFDYPSTIPWDNDEQEYYRTSAIVIDPYEMQSHVHELADQLGVDVYEEEMNPQWASYDPDGKKKSIHVAIIQDDYSYTCALHELGHAAFDIENNVHPSQYYLPEYSENQELELWVDHWVLEHHKYPMSEDTMRLHQRDRDTYNDGRSPEHWPGLNWMQSKQSMALTPEMYEQLPQYLWHVTQRDHVVPIMQQGLRPASETGWSRDTEFFVPRANHVYMMTSQSQALTSERYMSEGLTSHGDVWNLPVLLRIDKSYLDPTKFKADEDHFFYSPGQIGTPPDMRDWYRGDAPTLGEWAEDKGLDQPDVVWDSVQGGTVAYEGTVPPAAITVWMMPRGDDKEDFGVTDLNHHLEQDTQDLQGYSGWKREARATMFHVAPQDARESILANGLNPDHPSVYNLRGTDRIYDDLQAGGDPTTYNPQAVYLWGDFTNAEQWRGGRGGDIYLVDASGLNIHTDNIITDRPAFFTFDPIPPDRLKLLTPRQSWGDDQPPWSEGFSPNIWRGYSSVGDVTEFTCDECSHRLHGRSLYCSHCDIHTSSVEDGIYYHESPSRNRESILSNGLIPNWDEEVDDEPGVFLTPNPNYWMDEGNMEGMDIWRVDTNGLTVKQDPWGAVNDIDYMNHVGGSFYVAHDIPPERLTLYHDGSNTHTAAEQVTIERGDDTQELACPECSETDLAVIDPGTYECYNCRHEFDELEATTRRFTTYKAYLGTKEVGELVIDIDQNRIANVYVDPSYRRQGIASALLTQARQDMNDVSHSDNLSPEGEGWMRAVGVSERPIPPSNLHLIDSTHMSGWIEDDEHYDETGELPNSYREGKIGVQTPPRPHPPVRHTLTTHDEYAYG